jgi:signal transduction histidine kinase
LIGDSLRLRQILTNLVGNAIKFTERGEMVIRVEMANEAVENSHPSASSSMCLHYPVRDTGIGIPANKQQVIFDEFAQADNSPTRKFGGTVWGWPLALSWSARWAAACGLRASWKQAVLSTSPYVCRRVLTPY